MCVCVCVCVNITCELCHPLPVTLTCILAGVESEEPQNEEPAEELKPPSISAPPPIPERKTPSLITDVKDPTPPPPPPQTQPPPSTIPTPSQPVAEEPPKVKSKPRVKPPPPKPKKEEPEIPPWQMEIQKRKERRAQESLEIAESMMIEKEAVEREKTPPAETKADDDLPLPLPVKTTPTPPPPQTAPPPPQSAPPPPQTAPPPPVEKQGWISLFVQSSPNYPNT